MPSEFPPEPEIDRSAFEEVPPVEWNLPWLVAGTAIGAAITLLIVLTP